MRYLRKIKISGILWDHTFNRGNLVQVLAKNSCWRVMQIFTLIKRSAQIIIHLIITWNSQIYNMPIFNKILIKEMNILLVSVALISRNILIFYNFW